MVGKNNIDALNRKSANKVNRYGIRRLSVGVASVAVAGLLFMADTTLVQAAEENGDAPVVENSPAGEELTKPEAPFADVEEKPEATVDEGTPAEETEEAPKAEEAQELGDVNEGLEISDDKNREAVAAPAEDSANGSDKTEEDSTPEPAIAPRAAAGDEDTTVGKDANNAVHGFVGVQAGGDLNLKLDGATGQQFKPVEGVKVYFQWFEKWSSGKEYTSPVYSTTSGADGQFHMGIKPYLAPDGNLIQFDADTTVSGGNERYLMWVDESSIPEGYALQYITGESVVFPGSGLPITQGGSSSSTPSNTHNDWKVLLRQLPKSMHKEATDTPVESKTGGNISGNVSWDYSSGVG